MAITGETVTPAAPQAAPAPSHPLRRRAAPALGAGRAGLGRGLLFVEMPAAPVGLVGTIKRWIDLSLALPLVLLALPLGLLVALAIKLDSRGPVFISQDRVGLDLRPFQMLKFRSMVDGADRMRQDISELNEARGGLFKIRDDPRLTRVGRLLRRTSLDELPQLLNVVRGDMSLVGPRPPFSWEVESDFVRQSIRLRFRPGMTGLWQVSGRSLLSYDEMIRLDLQYTRRWSPGLDLRILLMTVPTVVSGRGAF